MTHRERVETVAVASWRDVREIHRDRESRWETWSAFKSISRRHEFTTRHAKWSDDTDKLTPLRLNSAFINVSHGKSLAHRADTFVEVIWPTWPSPVSEDVHLLYSFTAAAAPSSAAVHSWVSFHCGVYGVHAASDLTKNRVTSNRISSYNAIVTDVKDEMSACTLSQCKQGIDRVRIYQSPPRWTINCCPRHGYAPLRYPFVTPFKMSLCSPVRRIPPHLSVSVLDRSASCLVCPSKETS